MVVLLLWLLHILRKLLFRFPSRLWGEKYICVSVLPAKWGQWTALERYELERPQAFKDHSLDVPWSHLFLEPPVGPTRQRGSFNRRKEQAQEHNFLNNS